MFQTTNQHWMIPGIFSHSKPLRGLPHPQLTQLQCRSFVAVAAFVAVAGVEHDVAGVGGVSGRDLLLCWDLMLQLWHVMAIWVFSYPKWKVYLRQTPTWMGNLGVNPIHGSPYLSGWTGSFYRIMHSIDGVWLVLVTGIPGHNRRRKGPRPQFKLFFPIANI